MYKDYKNTKGFLILEISRKNILKANPYNEGICDSCNDKPITGYYIACLARWYCKTCLNEWYTRAINYPEDKAFEKLKYLQMKRSLNQLN